MRIVRQLAAASTLLATSGVALAHGGHGLGDGLHWHATDVAGLVLVVVLTALAIYFSRGG